MKAASGQKTSSLIICLKAITLSFITFFIMNPTLLLPPHQLASTNVNKLVSNLENHK